MDPEGVCATVVRAGFYARARHADRQPPVPSTRNTLAAPALQWCRLRPPVRDCYISELEVEQLRCPMAARGSVAHGANVRPAAPPCPRSQLTREYSVRMGRSPARIWIWCILNVTEHLWWTDVVIFYLPWNAAPGKCCRGRLHFPLRPPPAATGDTSSTILNISVKSSRFLLSSSIHRFLKYFVVLQVLQRILCVGLSLKGACPF